MSETNQQNREPTEAELKAYREKMIQYYKEQIPLLKSQKEYEILLADIEEARAKRLTMTMRIAQIMAPPSEEKEQISNPTDSVSKEQKSTRQLKKDEA